jgi:hypothetical protein
MPGGELQRQELGQIGSLKSVSADRIYRRFSVTGE